MKIDVCMCGRVRAAANKYDLGTVRLQEVEEMTMAFYGANSQLHSDIKRQLSSSKAIDAGHEAVDAVRQHASASGQARPP